MWIPKGVNSTPLFVAIVKQGVLLSSPICRVSFVVMVAWGGGRRKVLEATGMSHLHHRSGSNFGFGQHNELFCGGHVEGPLCLA